MTEKTAAPAQGDHRNPEFKGMPKKTKATLRAEEVVVAYEAVEDKKSVLLDRQKALILQMKAEEIKEVTCLPASGVKHRFNIEELEKLKMRKAG